MIAARLITRTHYQVLEPAYLTPLVRKCTSPTQSSYRDAVAQTFSKITAGINIAASGYAVDLARSLNLLNANLVWTDLGQLLNVIAVNENQQTGEQLSPCERILFLRLFLEYDGAALIYFSRKLEEQPRLPAPGESWASVAQEMFLDIYEQYLQLITDPQARTQIRQLAEKRRHSPFRGHSGRHQSLIHIHTLFRLGLVYSTIGSHERVYSAKSLTGESRLATSELLAVVPDVSSLEHIVRNQCLYEAVGRALGIQCRSGPIDDEEFMHRVREIYGQVMKTGVSLCSLQTILRSIADSVSSSKLGSGVAYSHLVAASGTSK